MRGGFAFLASGRHRDATSPDRFPEARVAVEGGIEQGETVAAARNRYTYGLPRSSTRVCHACWGVLQRGPEKLITEGYRAIFECVVRGFVVTRRIQDDIGPRLIMTIVRHRRHRVGWSARGHRAASPLPQEAVAESGRSFRP